MEPRVRGSAQTVRPDSKQHATRLPNRRGIRWQIVGLRCGGSAQRYWHRLHFVAEDWARSHGCVEMASDTWIDNELSKSCHEALGFEIVDRCVHCRKALQVSLTSHRQIGLCQ